MLRSEKDDDVDDTDSSSREAQVRESLRISDVRRSQSTGRSVHGYSPDGELSYGSAEHDAPGGDKDEESAHNAGPIDAETHSTSEQELVSPSGEDREGTRTSNLNTSLRFEIICVDDELPLLENEFRELRHDYPQIFDYVILPSRLVDTKLTPLIVVLCANFAYCLIFLLVNLIQVTTATQTPRLHWLDQYQIFYFRAMNSTSMATLLVDSGIRALILGTPLRRSFFFVASLIMILPALVSHCLIGAVLYPYIVLPLLVFPLSFDHFVRTNIRFRSSAKLTRMFLLRSVSRVTVLFGVCTALSLSYNYALLFAYSRVPRGPQVEPYFSAMGPRVGYVDVIWADMSSRKVSCVFEELSADVVNVLQHLSSVVIFF
jgi:hypothetical protein